jgi:hypothetical protein
MLGNLAVALPVAQKPGFPPETRFLCVYRRESQTPWEHDSHLL